MKPKNTFLAALATCFFTASATIAEVSDPNGLNNTAKSEWSLWHPLSEIKPEITYGYSNATLVLNNEMEFACSEAAEGKKLEYWYRLSDMLNYTGNGAIEIGCWLNGSFLHTWTISQAFRAGWEWSKPLNCNHLSFPSNSNAANQADKSQRIETLLSTKACPECNLEGASLKAANLSLAHLEKANLSSANLEEISAYGANFKAANLSNAGLKNAYLERANLSCANLEKADLTGAALTSANLLGANLKGAKLEGIYLKIAAIDETTQLDAKWRIVWEIGNQGAKGRNLREADLSGAILIAADLEQANLMGANLKETELGSANLKGANLEGADLRNAKLRGTDLRGANLKNADLQNASLNNTNFCGATMPDGVKSNQGC